MRMLRLLAAASIVVALAAPAGAADPVGTAFATAATQFHAALDERQRAQVSFAFEDAERFDWHYTPRSRKGLALGAMSPVQRELALALVRTGLSEAGYAKVAGVIALEGVLRELEGTYRDPGLYFVTLFGQPGAAGAWALRMEGHHLSLHFTFLNGAVIATTPMFFGANPAEIQAGPRKGDRLFAAEEDAAVKLLNSLDPGQRVQAVISASTYGDIVSGNARELDPARPEGLAARNLDEGQRRVLMQLVAAFAQTLRPELSAQRLARVEEGGLGGITFAWAGRTPPAGDARGPYYFRIQGPLFLIEFDRTQGRGNHAHAVWRDYRNDWGRDALREHYRRKPHAH
jgi:hypothetical protein